MKEAQCAHPPPLDNDDVIGSYQCLCLPKVELNTKTQPYGSSAVVWLSFWCSTRFTKKSDTFKIEDRLDYDVICGWPLMLFYMDNCRMLSSSFKSVVRLIEGLKNILLIT